MKVDVDRLRAGLEEYRATLEKQREQLRDEFAEMQHLFDALWSVQGGAMAEDLQNRWGHTAQWFEEYIEAERRLDSFLLERIEQLRQL